eukprot:GHVU01064489.1.p3 GENE.GHVU01064489.1~~GHVU01064489.1.p3  ORF type:complete len:131 (-),score=17.43 GHVU01064489.1:769-1161(-)
MESTIRRMRNRSVGAEQCADGNERVAALPVGRPPMAAAPKQLSERVSKQVGVDEIDDDAHLVLSDGQRVNIDLLKLGDLAQLDKATKLGDRRPLPEVVLDCARGLPAHPSARTKTSNGDKAAAARPTASM